jgi:Asp-tRNA(Asn)/Glu-tRNA(Gln) amidotransferase A subunit family amidase
MWLVPCEYRLIFAVFIPSNVCSCLAFLIVGSTGRFPRAGNVSNMPGQEGVKACYSPMTRSLDSLSYFLKAVIDQKPWDYDPSCDPIPWRDITLPKKLTIGFLRDDGISLV